MSSGEKAPPQSLCCLYIYHSFALKRASKSVIDIILNFQELEGIVQVFPSPTLNLIITQDINSFYYIS